MKLAGLVLKQMIVHLNVGEEQIVVQSNVGVEKQEEAFACDAWGAHDYF